MPLVAWRGRRCAQRRGAGRRGELVPSTAPHLQWLPPEALALDPPPPAPAVDLYGFGALLWELHQPAAAAVARGPGIHPDALFPSAILAVGAHIHEGHACPGPG